MNVRDYSWKHYGIDDEEKKKLRLLCENKLYKELVETAAYNTEPLIAEWIIESVTCHKTYEDVEFDRNLGRIPLGRTDFYGYRRRFYYNFKDLVQQRGKTI